MYRVGVDLVEISRIEKSVKSRRFTERVFSEKEIALFLPRKTLLNPWQAIGRLRRLFQRLSEPG